MGGISLMDPHTVSLSIGVFKFPCTLLHQKTSGLSEIGVDGQHKIEICAIHKTRSKNKTLSGLAARQIISCLFKLVNRISIIYPSASQMISREEPFLIICNLSQIELLQLTLKINSLKSIKNIKITRRHIFWL